MTKKKIVTNSKMKVIKKKAKRTMTQAQDDAYDMKHGVKDKKYKMNSKAKAYLKRVGGVK